MDPALIITSVQTGKVVLREVIGMMQAYKTYAETSTELSEADKATILGEIKSLQAEIANSKFPESEL